MIEQKAVTNHTVHYTWKRWKESGEPDLSPITTVGMLYQNVRMAVDAIADEKIDKDSFRRKYIDSDGNYTGPRSLSDVFNLAFDAMDDRMRKLLNNIFDTMMKKYYTIIFTDPAQEHESVLYYASPNMMGEFIEFMKDLSEQVSKAEESDEDTPIRINACKVLSNGACICGQPVSGRVSCRYWYAPESGNPYQCYYQDRNPGQTSIDDGLFCLCEEAWKDKSKSK